jgi:hypothetical protein
VSEATATGAFCVLCNDVVEEDLETHFSNSHTGVLGKPRIQILSPAHRLDRIIRDLTKVRGMSNPKEQLEWLDGTLKEMYLVRAAIHAKVGKSLQRVKE